ncbi:hypothetical protein RHGRI_034333 [Rhododendron griersonianum]|uniref:Uncharacterized protein n=1 Tax=Rhododendron griersonianum TaxID=479676 RepID=A0AAV6I0A6_9ERIC|nr:hypothetical protein RHGRI_034333 [Rhododendron griersonianum]
MREREMAERRPVSLSLSLCFSLNRKKKRIREAKKRRRGGGAKQSSMVMLGSSGFPKHHFGHQCSWTTFVFVSGESEDFSLVICSYILPILAK